MSGVATVEVAWAPAHGFDFVEMAQTPSLSLVTLEEMSHPSPGETKEVVVQGEKTPPGAAWSTDTRRAALGGLHWVGGGAVEGFQGLPARGSAGLRGIPKPQGAVYGTVRLSPLYIPRAVG